MVIMMIMMMMAIH